MRYWEDLGPGDVFDLGTWTVDEDEIIDFAERWDPQVFHTDPDGARDTAFGGLIASGWHSAVIWMRLYVDAVLSDAASMGSPGLEELRWLRPVRPGTTLRGRLIIEDRYPSTRRDDRGTVLFVGELVDGEDEVVLRMRGRGLFGRREAGAAGGAPT